MSNKEYESRQRADDSQEYREFIAQKNREAQRKSRVTHLANLDEEIYSETFGMNFTKGLTHDEQTGLVKNTGDFVAFRRAILDGYIAPFHELEVPLAASERRLWEAPTAGFVFDPQGPDAQAVTMAPAPALGSDELAFELAEVYELSILRDVPFSEFQNSNSPDSKVDGSVKRLNSLQYAKDDFPGRPRTKARKSKLSAQTVFRGSSPGVAAGPYLSCFMLMGNNIRGQNDSSLQGQITYGAQTVDQRVAKAKENLNFMRSFDDWLAVQNGQKFDVSPAANPGIFEADSTFIHTPRDLATYVHFDALYQAYLNACLILIGQGAPFDPNFAALSGDIDDAKAGGFALYGPPHILSLVTEVATRALKAVRYQKFQVHRRLRPEALAGRLEKAHDIKHKNAPLGDKLIEMKDQLTRTIRALDRELAGDAKADCALLLMAFPEGSPMHPAYGAGHATVAGACVTVLKAFFDTSAVLKRVGGDIKFVSSEEANGEAVEVVTINDGAALDVNIIDKPLTLEGELNKLAANVSIGRNMAGVHYYTDYYDSLRMGEEIAIGILRDQAEGYPKDAFTLSLRTFDDKDIIITRSDR